MDFTPFTSVITLILGGGFAYAYAVWKKTPVEIESVSVATLRSTVETLQKELEWRDREISELRGRIEILERSS